MVINIFIYYYILIHYKNNIEDDINLIEDNNFKYLDEEINHCNNNHFLFENSYNIERAPLQSTICKVNIS